MFFKRLAIAGILLAVMLLFFGNRRMETVIQGETMGTSYTVKVVCRWFEKDGQLAQLIDEQLEAVNQNMSTYIPESEISRFNRLRDRTREGFAASPELLEVMGVAMKMYQLSQGAWDGTLEPLVNLWGFGREGFKGRVPSQEAIANHLKLVGFDGIEITPEGRLVKKIPGLRIDLSSIAKGYGVDKVTALLEKRGYANFLVEVGGEVYATGNRLDGTPWKIGITVPERAAPMNAVYKAVRLEHGAFATSGDYRNYFEAEDRLYSHILDPRTGYPITNGVVSASVVAENCTFADVLATALMVLGPEEGIKLVEELPQVEALILVRDQEGQLHEYASTSFYNLVI